MTMLRDAHMKHLISDKYKKHLQSVPSGDAIPRSPEGYFTYPSLKMVKKVVLQIHFKKYSTFSQARLWRAHVSDASTLRACPNI